MSITRLNWNLKCLLCTSGREILFNTFISEIIESYLCLYSNHSVAITKRTKCILVWSQFIPIKKFQHLISNDDSVTIVIKTTLWRVVMTVVFITRDFVKFVLYLQTNVILSLVAQKGKCDCSKRIRQSANETNFIFYIIHFQIQATKP